MNILQAITPRYFSCAETGLSACEIHPHLIVKVDGWVKNTNPSPYAKKPTTGKWQVGSDDGGGYLKIGLPLTTKVVKIHILIARAFLVNTGEGVIVDHLNGNTYDNSIANLRWATPRLNAQNRHTHRNGKLVGACWRPHRNKWQARIKIGNINHSLGYFDTELEAHERYMQVCAKVATGGSFRGTA